MPIQINVPLTARTGQSVPAGSYCVLDIHVSLRKRATLQMRIYVSKSNFDNLDDPFTPKEIPLRQTEVQLTDQQYADLTVIGIHEFVRTYLHSVLGPGTTQLVN